MAYIKSENFISDSRVHDAIVQCDQICKNLKFRNFSNIPSNRDINLIILIQA